MITKSISKEQLKKAIQIAFSEDKEIINFYDPHRNVSTVEGIVADIVSKVDEYGIGVKNIGVYEKNALIGYFVYCGKMLVSFALKMSERTRSNLRAFFRLIKKTIGNDFVCYLFDKNKRAIRWLQKNGMRIEKQALCPGSNHLITKLI